MSRSIFLPYTFPMLLGAVLLIGGLLWWSARDREVAARPSIYVALGASDAVGIGTARPADDGWVPLVHDGLPAGSQLVNLGINGATLDDVLRLELPVAVDARPRWVSIWPGVNDLRAGVPLETFASQLDTILSHLAGEPETEERQLIVLTIPDLRLLPAFATANPAALDATVRQWNTAIATAAERHGALLVDLYGARLELEDHPEYVSDDGFHPSRAGYRRIADLVLEVLNERSHHVG